MKRRHLLHVLGASAGAAAASVPAGAQCNAQAGLPATYASIPAVCRGDIDEYFTEKKLQELVDTSKPLRPAKYQVVAYNYPCWHVCPWFEKYFGKGWTQFQSLRDAKPLFPGHLFPKYPLWGEFNEADPEGAAREIEAAVSHGIDVWMHCWYWQEGTMRCQLQLQDGFLKARNRQQLKFAVMWANHDWSNHWPGTSEGQTAPMSRQRHSEADLLQVMDYCIEHYFREPNYWRLDGALVFGIYSIGSLLRDMAPDDWLRALGRMRERVAKAGLGEIHLQANAVTPADVARVKELGFQSATLYNTAGPATAGLPKGGETPGLVTGLPQKGLSGKPGPLFFHQELSIQDRVWLGGENKLGLGSDTDGVLARYDLSGQPFDLIIIEFPDASRAQKGLQALQRGDQEDLLAAAAKNKRLAAVFGKGDTAAAEGLLNTVPW